MSKTNSTSNAELDQYITSRQDRDPYFKSPFDYVVDIAATERNTVLLRFAVDEGGRASKPTLERILDEKQYEDLDYCVFE